MTLPRGYDFSIAVHNPLFSPSVANGENLLTNGSFESAFTGWTQNTDGGNVTITQESTTPAPQDGSFYCQMYSVAKTGVGHIYQNVTATPGTRYRLSIWSRIGDIYADMQGRFAVYDVTNGQWIISREPIGSFSEISWYESAFYFTTPSDCSQVRIYLYQSVISSSYVYYDNISLSVVQPGELNIVDEYTSMINSYKHRISTNIGFDSMEFTTTGSQEFIEDWLEDGLGRHIVVSEATAGIIWSGFINQIRARIGGFSITMGPLTNIINRSKIAFNELDWAGLSPVGGDQVSTQWRDNLASIKKYGILEGIISGGDGLFEEMNALLGTILEEVAWPPSESNVSIGGSSGLSLNVECLGYAHLMEKYYYSQVAVAGQQDLSDKIKAVVSRDPNNLIRYSGGSISPNSLQVGVYEDGTRTGLSIVKELSNLGDGTDTRHVFGVYENRILRYNPVGTDFTYRTQISEGILRDASAGPVQPWAARPSVWILVDDIFVGRGNIARPSEDPRMIFIESIDYTAPYNLSISGGRANTFKQKIERLGLGGL